MHTHFIAIGGSAMHNLAIALHLKGNKVTGSDDEIFEPSKGRLRRHGLLPDREGWNAALITTSIDEVIVGMHAKADNPELIRARELGLKIFSYPEYLYEQSKDKTRIVIGGSHGKTTITAMILHVMQRCGLDCDYMVGAQLDGFDVMVKLSREAKVMVIEGDEYLTSPIDPRPKFHLYMPDIAVLSGIAWDHINVFTTFESYLEQFRQFIHLITPGGHLIYCSHDPELEKMCPGSRTDITITAYHLLPHIIQNGITSVITDGKAVSLEIFGQHNLLNLNAARNVCRIMGINDPDFFKAISSFRGASKRLELVASNSHTAMYKDFAHAPSKVKATLQAVREQYPDRKIIACLELHTYSSLNKDFLSQYSGSLDAADVPLVYFNPHALMIKRLPPITPEQICEGFANPRVNVFNDSAQLRNRLLSEPATNAVYLMMSSGNYDGISMNDLARALEIGG